MYIHLVLFKLQRFQILSIFFEDPVLTPPSLKSLNDIWLQIMGRIVNFVVIFFFVGPRISRPRTLRDVIHHFFLTQVTTDQSELEEKIFTSKIPNKIARIKLSAKNSEFCRPCTFKHSLTKRKITMIIQKDNISRTPCNKKVDFGPLICKFLLPELFTYHQITTAILTYSVNNINNQLDATITIY